MKISYFDKISPSPIFLNRIGSIKKHTLKEISVVSYEYYQLCLSIFLLTPYRFYEEKNALDYYQNLSKDVRSQMSIYELLINDKAYSDLLFESIQFFFIETPRFDPKTRNIMLYHDDQMIGVINKNNWEIVVDIVTQINNVEKEQDVSTVANKKARKILEKLQKHREKNKGKKSFDPNMDIGNVVSVLAAFSNMNYDNIWNLTIPQLWDLFERFRFGEIYNLTKTNISVWGDKKNQFDVLGRTKLIDRQ